MKTLFLILISFLSFHTGLKAQQTTSALTVQKAELQVNGLTCSMCNLSVYKALQKVSFVDSIKTQLNSSVYTLTIKPGAYIDPSGLRKQVEDAGFSVGALRIFFQPMDIALVKDEHVSYGNFYFHVLKTPASKESWIAEIKDKKFISQKEYNRLRKDLSQHHCYESGMTSACCTQDANKESKQVYHLSF
ncbi:MAG: Heavy metal transport/detoxification protein [Cytophagaceae bacterium]|nr:Heavy metal transport/detoxification protein [Cytophagaceae bacterium]